MKVPLKSRALYEKIYDDLLEDIARGKYDHVRLPSEKELAGQYQVSRITSQKALNLLAENGHIYRVPGKGSFVRVEPAERKAPAAERPKLIGYIVRGIGPSYGWKLLTSLEESCRQQGCVLAIRFAENEAEESACIDALLAAGACGLIVVCVHGENYSERILRLVLDHYPIVLLDRGLQGIPASYVGTDNTLAAAELTRCLLDMGREHICCVSWRVKQAVINVTADREQGFRQEMMRRGCMTDAEQDFLLLEHEGVRRSEETVRGNMETIRHYVQEHPEKDGYLCLSHSLAEEVLMALEELGLAEEKEIVCFGSIDTPLLARRFTHVQQDEHAMGKQAVQALLQAIGGDRAVRKILVPHTIVCR